MYEDVKLTYRELNERSNQLAHYLLETYKIQPDELIPLCLERSEQMLIGILGVLKSGGAYVPMDPNYPMDRIEHILGDTKARMVLVEENTKDRLYEYKELTATETESSNLSIISLDSSEMKAEVSTCSTDNPNAEVSSGDLSYVIYTSGTTGKPKGVMIEHKSVVRLFSATDHWYGFTDKDVWSLFHSYVFDFSVWEMWGALLHGGKLLIPSLEQTKDLYLFFDVCHREAVTVLNQTPTAFYQFTEVALSKDVELSSLRYVIFGGEALNFASLEPWYGRYSEAPLLINMYGITETTVHVSYRPLDSEELGSASIVGTHIPDQRIYVLDEYLRPVPVGAVGELYIGGAGLSRGYLNLAELTSERFLLNPFQSEEEKSIGYNDRMYKTGDLGRYLSGGDLEYIGRNDFQVKIRGYRIELGEIENALLSYEGIRQSVVLAKENSSGLKYLVGYYVSDVAVDHEDLSVYLSGLLPEYMVPSVYVDLEELPLTINGKLDHRALPEPNFTGDKEYIAPETSLQRDLAAIYSEVLGLPVESIGLHDDFFRLGGNSIMAIKLISKIHQGLGLQASVAMVFSHKTIFGLAGALEGLSIDIVEMIRPIAVHHPEQQLLSFAQERLWFIDQYEGGSSAYNIPMVFGLSSQVDLSILKESFKVLLSRHDILRTLILTNSEGIGYQYVSNEEFNIKETDVFNSRELEDLISQEITRVFNLSQELLISVQVFHEKEKAKNNNDYISYISIVIHHIAFDGWSSDIFLEELGVIYRDLLSGHPVSLPSLHIQYKDFALWQRSYLQGEVLDRQLNYWKTKLSGVESLNLPLDYARPSVISYEGNTVHFSIADTLGEELRFLSRDLGVSLYSVMLGGYYLLLSSYSGQKDIVLGTVVANRHHAGLEDLIGFFVNTLVLREEIDYGVSVRDFILQVSDSVSQAQMHQDVPFEKLVEELGVVQDVSRHPLFQVMFGLQSFGNEVKQKYGDGSLFHKFEGNVSYDVAKFDLSVMIDDGDSLSGSFNYATHLFKESTIDYMIKTYVYLLEQMVCHHKESGSKLLLEDISWIREEEHRGDGIFSNLLDTYSEYDTTATLHELFERQVEKTPDHIALVYEDVKVTYRELNERSNQLAHYLLQNYQIQSDELITLCLERSEEMLIAILGVLKSGGAYVPMDPNYPMDRIEHILGDTKARIVIVEENTKDRLYEYKELIETESSNLSIISLNGSEMKAEVSTCSTDNPNIEVSPEALAYVIYTSGTTGKPKGVMIEHRNINRFIHSNFTKIGESDNVLSLSSYQFDGSIYDFFYPLVYGGSIILSDKEEFLNPDGLNVLLEKYAITNLFMTTALFNIVVDSHLSGLTRLDSLLFGGEHVSVKHVSKFRDLYKDTNLVHVYGPTESTTFATAYSVNVCNEGYINSVPIGCPISNTTTYVLDEYLRPVPIGAVGELYIGGAGLSRGYLNLPKLTKERFLLNPFQSKEDKEIGYNGRIYKTGDLVRYLSEGDLEYIGRNDFQVKIRGYRIELGEIESALLSYEGIRQSVVLAKEHSSGLKYLVGYYVSDTSFNPEDLSVYLSGLLPEYMVPSAYVHLELFPMTLNGKLDRRALPEPNFTGDKEYIAPTTVLEKQLAEIYSEVLGLPVESIGIHDDFFRLGGNSIMAIKLISKIHQGLGLQANVAMVFSHKTVFGLAGVLEGLESGVSEMIHPIAVHHPEQQLLSFAQERLWFIDQYEGGSSAYNIPMVFGLSSRVDLSILEESFRILLSRHEILRTLIVTSSEGVGYQYVSNEEFSIKETYVESSKQLEDLISQEITRVFDLSKELPISVCVFHEKEKTNTNKTKKKQDNQNKSEITSYISIVIHHISFDGWSSDIFLEELRVIYRDLLSNNPVSLPSLRIQYKDFALWQRGYLQGEVLDRQLEYWKGKLLEVGPLNLPLDYPRPSAISYEGNTIHFSILDTLGEDLRLLSQDLGVSLYSIMLGGYYLLLSSYSGQKDIVLGTVVANRHHAGLEDLIGFFVNTLVLREEIDYGVSVRDFILQVSASVSEAQMHQDVPFEKLVEELGVVQDVSRHPLFQVMFGLQSFGSEAKQKYGDGSLFYKFEGNVSYDVAKFDLSVMIDDDGKSLSGSFNYAQGLFKESTIDHMIKTYVYLLEQMVSHSKDNRSELKLENLSWIREEEYSGDGIFSGLLDTYSEYDTSVTIHELFERQVEKTPDHIALVYEDVKLSYRELNERSNQLAHYLLEHYQISPDELIPLCLERSEQMLIGILGVLKSGGAYVPMDPNYPMDRIEHILGDTKARMVIVEENTKDGLYDYKKLIETEEEALDIISLNNSEMKTKLSKCSNDNPNAEVGSGDLSYVIYTSGTTGKPKGVMIEHKSVVRLFSATNHWYGFTDKDVWSLFHSYVFDVSVWEMWGALLHGGKLLIPSVEQTKDLYLFFDLCYKNNLTVLCKTPTAFYQFIEVGLSKDVNLFKLRYVIFAGEALNFASLEPWYGRYPESPSLINMYGTTETTVHASYRVLDSGELGNSSMVGKSIPDQRIYVLDEYLRPVPVGAVGELYIGGSGLSRGYLNLAELTSERFLLNPFQSEEEKAIGYNDRMYKTGDLGRYLPGGDLEYIGRNDFQVKIRGYRIELGEIENGLLSYEGIRQSVVLAKENSSGLKYLVGYYVSDNAVNHEDLSVYLSERLPEYMVPSVYVHLEEFPLTINGKLDRRALPEPNFTGDKEYIAPTTVLEKQLAEIYGKVLGLPLESIGLHDDFFRLGGNSIMAIKLISKIHQGLGLQASVAMVFSHKTVFGLAGVLKDLDLEGGDMIRPIAVPNPEQQLLSFAQERLWFIDQYEGGSSAYNIPMVFGLSSRVDLSILKESFKILLSRHDILRTLIVTSSEGVGYQYVSDHELSIKETYVESSKQLEDLISQEVNRVFDLSKELPISVCVFNDKDEVTSYLSIVIHHIAFDGWSIDIFLEELLSIYQDLLTNSSVSLPLLRIQYKDFALWQRDYLQGEVLDRQLDYWKVKLLEVEPLNLPLDYARPSAISYEGNTVHFSISDTLGEELRLLSRDLGVSLYSVMLGGYYLLLSSYSGQKDIVLGTVVANRHHAGLEDLIGFFVNTLVLREKIDYGVSVRDFILQVSDSVSEAQMHQDVPFEKLVEELGVVQDVSRHPLFQVMFGLQSFGSEAKQKYGDGSLFYKFEGNVSYDVSKFDLTVMIDDGGDSLSGSFNYATHLFKESTIDHMIKTYVYLLEQMVCHQKESGSKLLLEDLSWVREEEYSVDGIFSNLLGSYSEYDTTVTIHELFERQVEKTPDHIALVYEDVKLSYRELNDRSNQLAHYLLQNYEIKPDELIPLCLERSEQMLIGILGVLKSGGAYVPMDPNYPMDRIEHILGDTKARIVIGEEKTKGRLYEYTSLMGREGESLNIISLTTLDMKGSLSACSRENPNTRVSSEALSYVIYTSGTTGKPKGVMIEHRNVVNLIEQQSILFSLNTVHSSSDPQKRALWYANYVFDAHVWDVYCFLAFGHCLHLINKEIQKDLSTLHRYIAENAIQIASIAPVLLTKELILPLDTLIVAGDITHPDVMECYTKEGVDIVNGYGPTESTVCTTYHHYHEDHNPLNIGRSISNIITYVLDGYLRPVPIGAVGELYIGGAGLSRGYLNLPELTKERFLVNPFQNEEDRERGYNRIYKTGDLVRFLANGEIEYMGRNDFQVKIRGYRIELGEIENSLLSYAGIRQGAVLVKEHSSGFKYLVGYYVSDVAVDHEDLFLYLSGLLPDYMVPSVYVHLEELPMTLNGKLDRRALPEPSFTGNKEYIAPTTVLEKQLAEIYSEVLGLPVENIGLHDDFFRLGGNSIMAIKLISKIHQGLGLQVSVAMVFSHKTVFGLAGALEGLSIDIVEMIRPIAVHSPEQQRLSFAQERLWFIDQYEGGSSAYNIPMVFGLSSRVDLSILKESFKVLLSRHEILRTLIVTSSEGVGYQYVSNEEFNIKETDVFNSKELEDLVSQEITRVFDLSKELPISVCVFYEKEKNNNHELSSYISIVIHHISFDGWSIDIFLEELRIIYQDLLSGNPVSLPSLPIQYKDFALWQRSYLQGEVLEKQLDYWRTKLSEVAPLNLPLDYARPSVISYKGNTIHFSISDTLAGDLRFLSQDLGVSLYSVMLGGYYLLLSSYSGQKDIVLGTVVANRHHAGLEDLIGFFVNTPVLREEIDYGVSVRDFILQVSDSVSEAQVHQDVPFEKLVEELGVVQDVSRHPLFQVMFGLQSFGNEAKQKYGDGSLFHEFEGNVSYDVAKFDLTVMIDDGGDSLSGSFNYATHLFKESTIDHMISTYIYLLEQIVSNQKGSHSELQLRDLSWVREEEYKIEGMLSDLLDATIEYDSTVTIHELFERQVEKTPDHIALVYEDVKLTYIELNERSNQLAHYLLETYKIQPDELIPLCLERSEQMLIGILGVLKSGGAYVPMDPNYPMDRIEHILGDTKARLVIVEENTKDRLYEYKKLIETEEALDIISLNNSEMKTKLSKCSNDNPNAEVGSGDLSYVIYTSGTTGKPKGVMIEHKSVVRLFSATDHWYGFTDKDVWSLFHSYVFDVSVWEMWGALLHGGKLLIPSLEQTKDLYLFFDLCYKNNLTVLCKTPTAFYQFIEVGLSQDVNLSKLRYVIFAGEALNFASLEPWYGRYPESPSLINMYGTTETTVHASYRVLDSGELGNSSMVGKSIPDQRIYVLDGYLRPVPVGAVGELYIGGAGLSRGYLNLVELTEERFLLNPFQSEEEKARGYNDRMYKTGDLGRYLPGGDLEYIDRNDFQVKIRGYRIELGEIENGLLSYEGIRQSIVLAKENSSGLKYLVGYYVSDNAVNPEDLSVYLSERLPEYMVPSVYVHLEEFPLTINGKLDRKALPEPNFTGDKEYIAPTTVLEKQLAEIYGKVLGLPLESIGLHDDFFRLGGNSIMAIKLISKIHQGLGLQTSVAMVFSHKTVFGLAGVLKDLDLGGGDMIRPIAVPNPEQQLLSFAQERLWFIDQYEGGSHVYNIPMVFGLSEDIDMRVLKESFRILLSRHEILRTLILTNSDGIGYQYVSDHELSIKETYVESSQQLEDLISQEVNRVFDLSKELPISVQVFHEKEKAKNNNDYISYISIIIHHIAFDGWSIDIFLEELRSIYQDLLTNSSVSLPSLRIQYKDFALWQREYLQGEVLDRQLDYWKNKLIGLEALHLPLDYARPTRLSYEGHTVCFNIPESLDEDLRLLSRDLGVSLYSVMLGGYYLLLSSYSGQKDIVLGTAIANRHHAGLEDLIGFFVNTLVLREKIDYGVSVKDFILQVSDSVSEAQMHQDVPFEKLVEELGVVQDVSRHPLFQVMFGLQSFGSKAKQEYGVDSLFQQIEGRLTYDVAKFDLSVMIDDDGENLSGSFNYAIGLFNEITIAHMINTYVYLLEQMVYHHKEVGSKLLLEDLSWIRKQEYGAEGILDTYLEYDRTVPLHELFERQVEKTSNDIALVYEDVKLTYRELNDRSNQLAHYLLHNYKIQSNELIPLCLERSEDMLVAILGVLKSGGAYVPMDPGYPMDRIEHILKDTKARLVIGEEYTTQNFVEFNLSVISLDSPDIENSLNSCSTENPNTEVSSSDLSYVIYTSGTTGKPKGVMIEHGGVVNLVSDLYSRYDLNSADVILQFANYVFDASVEQMFLALLHGNTLVLIKDKSYLNEELFLKTLSDHKVSYMHLTPSVLKGMDVTKVKSLRILNSGGEHLADDLYNRLQNKQFRLVNSYGPTETTVTSIVNTGNGFNNIGRAIANTTTYVLDEYLRPVPVGAIGELYIGGVGLSRGYLNLAELTAERFLLNPFQSEEEKEIGYNDRMYKTGDLVRYLANGDLEYIGRNDFQVKIRGFRIELGEIENGLLSYAGIRQAVALAKENSSGFKYLVGYYVSDIPVNYEDLSMYLSGLLPEYMVPSVYVHLEELPLTINGKLDRKALPDPNFTGDKEYIAPETSLQRDLAAIYSELLGLPIESIGLHDDFFRLGGNSIMAVKLISKINHQLGVRIKVSDVFQGKTIGVLSSIIIISKPEYKPVVSLNNANTKPNMFMIHPGGGGCEVYQSLADQLDGDYHCYGVDSYNLYHEEKIDNLNHLAMYYLDHIDKIQKESQQEEYILLGWSLGGQIALEIASELENRGCKNIRVYLLDTILKHSDSELMKLNMISFSDEAISQRFHVPVDSDYFIQAKNLLMTELLIDEQNISTQLKYTKTILLKAMLKGNLENQLLAEYLHKLAYNNVDKILEDQNLLKVYPMKASHQTILKEEQAIIDIIKVVEVPSSVD
ncbi:Tyrocidine synthase 3 [Chryseobacterium potabilaquae]|uniref:Tyrocidine synthase 3 n=1 Tax=Chryseobacterium potabilaquae TaxID=2675057 RepID=A0A6N4X796_9FLAO|nr:Tyrocidine synthase 3 [Chryseobacterium potabilaquae]